MATTGMGPAKPSKTTYRLSPNEEAALLKQEMERRRKLRIQQVRDQERRFASKVRGNVSKKREEELQSLARRLRRDWQTEREEKAQAFCTLLEKSLASVGDGHRAAKTQPPLAEIRAAQAVKDQHAANQRFNSALKRQEEETQAQYQKENAQVLSRRSALQTEKVRAARIASLPPPQKDPIDELDDVGKENKVVTVVSGFSTSHYHLKGEYVEKAEPHEEEDARAAAQEAESRSRQETAEQQREERERRAKARLRHGHACQQERLRRDYDDLLGELGRMEQADRRRRQAVVADIPHQVFQPPHKRLEDKREEQQKLEQAFEDMYMANTDYTGDLILALEPKPTGDADLDVTLDSLAGDAGVTLRPVRAFAGAPATTTRPTEEVTEGDKDPAAGPSAADATQKQPRAPLKTLMDRIRIQREQLKTKKMKEVVLEVPGRDAHPEENEEEEEEGESEMPSTSDRSPPSPTPKGSHGDASESGSSTTDTLETGTLSVSTAMKEEMPSPSEGPGSDVILHPLERAAKVRSTTKLPDLDGRKEELRELMSKEGGQRLQLAEQQLQQHLQHRDHLQVLQDNLHQRQQALRQQIEAQERRQQQQPTLQQQHPTLQQQHPTLQQQHPTLQQQQPTLQQQQPTWQQQQPTLLQQQPTLQQQQPTLQQQQPTWQQQQPTLLQQQPTLQQQQSTLQQQQPTLQQQQPTLQQQQPTLQQQQPTLQQQQPTLLQQQPILQQQHPTLQQQQPTLQQQQQPTLQQQQPTLQQQQPTLQQQQPTLQQQQPTLLQQQQLQSESQERGAPEGAALPIRRLIRQLQLSDQQQQQQWQQQQQAQQPWASQERPLDQQPETTLYLDLPNHLQLGQVPAPEPMMPDRLQQPVYPPLVDRPPPEPSSLGLPGSGWPNVNPLKPDLTLRPAQLHGGAGPEVPASTRPGLSGAGEAQAAGCWTQSPPEGRSGATSTEWDASSGSHVPAKVYQGHSREFLQQRGSRGAAEPDSSEEGASGSGVPEDAGRPGSPVDLQEAQRRLQQRRQRLMQLYPELDLPPFEPYLEDAGPPTAVRRSSPGKASLRATDTKLAEDEVRDSPSDLAGEKWVLPSLRFGSGVASLRPVAPATSQGLPGVLTQETNPPGVRGLAGPSTAPGMAAPKPPAAADPLGSSREATVPVTMKDGLSAIGPDPSTTSAGSAVAGASPLNEMERQLESHRQQLLRVRQQLQHQQQQQRQRILSKQQVLAQRIEEQRAEQLARRHALISEGGAPRGQGPPASPPESRPTLPSWESLNVSAVSQETAAFPPPQKGGSETQPSTRGYPASLDSSLSQSLPAGTSVPDLEVPRPGPPAAVMPHAMLQDWIMSQASAAAPSPPDPQSATVSRPEVQTAVASWASPQQWTVSQSGTRGWTASGQREGSVPPTADERVSDSAARRKPPLREESVGQTAPGRYRLPAMTFERPSRPLELAGDSTGSGDDSSFHRLSPDSSNNLTEGAITHPLDSFGGSPESEGTGSPAPLDWQTILASTSGDAAASEAPTRAPTRVHARPPPAPLRLPLPAEEAPGHELSTILEAESPSVAERMPPDSSRPLSSTPRKSGPPPDGAVRPGTDARAPGFLVRDYPDLQAGSLASAVSRPPDKRTSTVSSQELDSRPADVQVLRETDAPTSIPKFSEDVGRGVLFHPASNLLPAGAAAQLASETPLALSVAVALPASGRAASCLASADHEGAPSHLLDSPASTLSEHTLPQTSEPSSSAEAEDHLVERFLALTPSHDSSDSAASSSSLRFHVQQLRTGQRWPRNPVVKDFVAGLPSGAPRQPRSSLSPSSMSSAGTSEALARAKPRPSRASTTEPFSLGPVSPQSTWLDGDSQSGSYQPPSDGLPTFSDSASQLSQYSASLESVPAALGRRLAPGAAVPDSHRPVSPRGGPAHHGLPPPSSDAMGTSQRLPGGATLMSFADEPGDADGRSDAAPPSEGGVGMLGAAASPPFPADDVEMDTPTAAGNSSSCSDDTLQEALRNVALSQDETSKETGILEDSDLTLLSLNTTVTSTTAGHGDDSDGSDDDVAEMPGGWAPEELGSDSLLSFLHHEEEVSAASPARSDSHRYQPVQTSSLEEGPVDPIQVPSDPEPVSLQEAFQRRKRAFVQASQSRRSEVKVRGQAQLATAFSQTLDNWKRSRGGAAGRRHSGRSRTAKSSTKTPRVSGQGSPVAGQRSSPGQSGGSVGETAQVKKRNVRSTTKTAADRKAAEREMHQRSMRLYNQLEEVRTKKVGQERQRDYAANRQKRRDFEQKLQTHLRSRMTRRTPEPAS